MGSLLSLPSIDVVDVVEPHCLEVPVFGWDADCWFVENSSFPINTILPYSVIETSGRYSPNKIFHNVNYKFPLAIAFQLDRAI